MATAQTATILGHIRGLIAAEKTKALPDAELLQRFAADRDEPAFADLMHRHGELVWGLCRRILPSHADAEDAFQATFLVLARQAGSIKKPEAVGSWLYGVAYRVAMKAKKRARQRQFHERRITPRPSVSTDLAWRELQAILDEEVQRLPEKYRAPFVFCCLESRAREEAMLAFGCPEGTLSSRIARARLLLATRLGRRGVTLSAALCAFVLWKQSASAALPVGLVRTTVRAVVAVAHGDVGCISMPVLVLARTGGPGAWFTKAHLGAIVVLSIGLLAAGVGAWAAPVASPTPQVVKPDDPPAAIVKPRKDRFGDPLPQGALARLGTVSLRAPNSKIAVTADGKDIVAVGSEDRIVRRFDAATGELRETSSLPPGIASQPWLSPGGAFVLIQYFAEPDDYQVQLWDVARKKVVDTLSLGKAGVENVSFSRDERTVALTTTLQQTAEVLVWDLKTSKSRKLWSLDKEINARYFNPTVVLSPDAKRVVAVHLDQVLRCWDVESGKLLWESAKKQWSPFVLFSPDGKQVVSTSAIGMPEHDVRDAATGEFIAEKRKTPEDASFPLGFSPDGKYLAIQKGSEELMLWEPNADKAAFTFPAPPHHPDSKMHYHPNPVPTNWAFTPDGKSLIRRCDALQRWDLTTGRAVYADTEDHGHTEAITRVVFSPDGKLVASTAGDKMLRLWDVTTNRPLQTFATGGCAYLAFTPNGQRVLARPTFGASKPALGAWDVATGKETPGFDLADRTEFMSVTTCRELRVSGDGKKVLMLTWKNGRAGQESMLTVWDAATRECVVHKRVPWNEDSVITPAGDAALAMEPYKGTVQLFDMATEKPRWVLTPPKEVYEHMANGGLAVSPQGHLMASCTRLFKKQDGKVKTEDAIFVGDLATGRERMKLQAAGTASLIFSDDERLFVVAGDEGIRLFETASWQEVGAIKLPAAPDAMPGQGWLRTVALSPDGRTLATGHGDATILLWDATLRAGSRGAPLTAAHAESLWTDLAGDDAARAYAAVWHLVDDPERTVPLLKARLEPAQPPPPDKVRALLADFDSADFEVRQAAEKKLTELVERIAPALQKALESKPSAEQKRRIDAVLERLDPDGPLGGDALRALRAVQILERIGSADARDVLKKLGQGMESARLTRAANQAVERLRK